ncbi:DUF2062 domain-containing protein [Halobacteriales archaeon QS_4_62_28]|nr:MAG: DUF2062 domain-containing protein [Halobacteriales archaeon QS_4_62_28]
MIGRRLRAYRDRVESEFEEMVAETHSNREVAASFATGIFITALPTLGTGLLLFFVIFALVDRASKIGLFASVVVLNPVAKWGVYGTSFWLGNALLGPVPGAGVSELSVLAGPAVVSRLVLGNLVIAVVFTTVAYRLAFYVVSEVRERDIEVVDLLPADP